MTIPGGRRRAAAPAPPGLRGRKLASGLLVLLVACAGPPTSQNDADSTDASDRIPSEEPSIRGTITAVDDGSIRVEENPEEEFGSAKALVRIGPAVAVRFADGSPAALGDLKAGVSVSVWFAGPVAESYPVQASAGAIRIDGGAGSDRP